MFKSQVRPINVPQFEHGRLAGIFASLWGNEYFDKPEIDLASFIQGVTLHDWHYGPIDNLPIGEASEEDWLKMVRKGADYRFDDPTSDIIAKLHLRRLLRGRGSEVVQGLVGQIEARIVERLPQTASTREHFEWADKITGFCDYLSFYFSFENPVERVFSLYPKVDSKQETSITYSVGPSGTIRINPWPFSRPSFSGIIIGYQRSGYPERLQPQVIPYYCQP